MVAGGPERSSGFVRDAGVPHVLLLLPASSADPDAYGTLKMGQEVWQSHARVPSSDHWSFTVAGRPWMAHEWLAQVSLYLAFSVAGYRGLQLWLCLLASAFVAAMYALCYRHCRNAPGAAPATAPMAAFLGGFLAFFFGTIGFALRPQMIGYLLLVGGVADPAKRVAKSAHNSAASGCGGCRRCSWCG